MQIFVKIECEKTISLEVEQTESVLSVKEKIQTIEGIPLEAQKLSCGVVELINSRTLSDYNIKNESTICLSRETMERISVQMLMGSHIIMNVYLRYETVARVKAEIFSKEKYPLGEQRLMFNGILLLDDLTLYSQGIRNESILHLALGPPLDLIYVKLPNGRTFSLKVKHSETVKEVKQNIEGSEGILVSQQHLKFGEVNMDDGSTLASFNILRGSTLELIKAQTQPMVSVQKRKREEEFICIDFVKVVGEKLGEKMFVVDAVDLDSEGDVLAMLRASAADAMGCRVQDVGEMSSRLDGEDAFTSLIDSIHVKRLKNMAQVRVVLRDAKDDEIDRLRAEKIQLAQQQAQQHVNSENSSGSASALVPPPPPPSVPSKSLQRLAAERLFITDCHVNPYQSSSR